MPEAPETTASHDVVPDDLLLLGRITAIAAAGGILGCGILWAAEPAQIESGLMVVVGVVLAAAVAAASLLLPWRRLSRRWVAFPVVTGAALTALATWNTGGTDSAFAIFYLYVATIAAYFASRRQTLLAAGIVTACAGLPILYDHGASFTDRIFTWALVSTMATALALVLHFQRERVRRATAHAHVLALQDPLTGVANRRGFEQRAAAELARARRHRQGFTVLYIDLDGFKRVNDVAGHAAGDELLRRVAPAIGVAVRGEDFVARHGGDEFAILLPGASQSEARRVAARVVAAVERTAADDPRLDGLSASVGGASYPTDGATVAELLEAADVELLRVKSERAFDRERASRDYAIPAARAVPEGDVFAGLDPGGVQAEPVAGRFEPWPFGAVLAACLVAVAAAWLLAPLTGSGELARRGLVAVASLAIVPAGLAAARRTAGTERAGWGLLAGVSIIVWLPFLDVPLGLGFGLAILLIGALSWPPDRRALLDLADTFAVLAAFAVVFLLPPLVGHAAGEGFSSVRSFGAAFLTTTGVALALFVVTRIPFQARPDVWLVSLGFGAAGVAASGLAATATDPNDLPTTSWQVVFALAAAVVAAGALLRARHPTVELPPADRRDGPGIVLGNLLLLGLLVSVIAAEGSIPEELLPLFCIVLLLRHLRSRMMESENARLQEIAHRSERDLAAQYRASLVALGTALEVRDGYTGDHGGETVTLVRRVSERLGLSEPAIAEAEAVALLHDVGKIAMPDALLRKPGPLDDHETRVMREHPLIGERILRQVRGLDHVARAVRHEHERWDGAGYPDGLAGEAIPLASRITLVCDAYHAMTSDRPYRPGMAHAEAADELRRCAGTQFDPAVVDALLDLPAEAPGRRSRAYQAAS